MQDTLKNCTVSPHFIFNTLSAIQYLCKHDPNKASDATLVFSRYLRHNIEFNKINTLNDFLSELHHAKDYISIINYRYCNKIILSLDTPVTNFGLPALLLVSIVESTFKNCICFLESPGRLHISTNSSDSTYILEISSDGFPHDTATYIDNLTLLIKKYDILPEDSFSINLSKTKYGTVVTVKIKKIL